jgi:hypothetical protein
MCPQSGDSADPPPMPLAADHHAGVIRSSPQTAAASPWTLAANAMSQLRRGGPDQLRVLIARAMGGLGIPELAEAWVSTVPQTPELAPLAAQIRAALPGLNLSERSADERVATLERNLGACPPLANDLAPFLDGWQTRSTGVRWFQTRDGQSVAVDGRLPIDHAQSLVRFGDERARCAGRPLPLNRPDTAGPPAPVLLHGVRSAESIADLCSRYQRLENRAWARLLIVEPNPDAVLDALSERDLREFLSQDRLSVFTGPDCNGRALGFLRERMADWASISYVSDGPGGPDRALEAKLKELTAARAGEYRALLARNNAAYADRDPAWWADRYQRARAGKAEPLKALVVTTRFSTYIQHASRDLCKAFESVGMRSHLLIEPDDASRTDGLRIARAIDTFRPDLFVMINYTRGQFADSVPRQVPHCCWVQDAMPHLFTRSAGADIDALSTVVGGVFREFVESYRYPHDACLLFDVPALAESFQAEPRSSCDIDVLIATNHGETPEAMAARLDRECAESGGPAGLMQEVHEALAAGLDGWHHGFLAYWIEDTLGPIFERHGYDRNAEDARTIIRDAAIPLVNRMLRHRVIGWAADLAEERGWNLVLAGRGWQSHPRFGAHAVGEVRHGPDLRLLYNRSLVTLHASSAWIFHQRIYESLLAGSMPAMLFKPDDLTGILRPARVMTRLGLGPSCSNLDDRRLHIHALDHPIGSLALSLAQRLAPAETPPIRAGRNWESERALQTGLFPWRDGVEDDSRYMAELHTPAEQMRLMWAVSDGFFRTKTELATLIENCRSRTDWRLARIRHAAGIVRASFTLEHAAEGIADFMHRRLASHNSADLSPAS